ncbi:hypothetical protein KFZ70_02605 [Tamlana fucoidanivorans]|uniref:Uncharacterized protein n=1 Tax=Allotamlana fucoidanivorans TaxID=2583814 RepID=A0A5C4SE61_9FLAO|nr:hypothetical protein [Tamlana fucoidanivorans]TNJ41875.1 hypothetical protein FGF67_15035 [Tamlana fucoidanivorans]
MKTTQICRHCGGDYTPKRRGAQKFCSNSCRSRHWYLKQDKTKLPGTTPSQEIAPDTSVTPPKKDSVNLAGVGNAAIGSITADIVQKFFTSKDNQPATKKDLEELKSFFAGKKYFPIHNLPVDVSGRKPYYNIETGHVEYLYLAPFEGS